MDALRGDTFSPADEDDSGAPVMLCVVAALLVIGIVSAISSLVTAVVLSQPTEAVSQEETVAVSDKPAEGVEVTEARTDGPIYDLPTSVSQTIVCDRLNREYLLLTTSQGGLCLVPYLDEDGNQAIMPQA